MPWLRRHYSSYEPRPVQYEERFSYFSGRSCLQKVFLKFILCQEIGILNDLSKLDRLWGGYDEIRGIKEGNENVCLMKFGKYKLQSVYKNRRLYYVW